MGSNRDADESVSGELMRRKEGRVPVVRALFATLSRLPFKNFWQRKKIASMREVIKEEKQFADDFVDHQRSVNRLLNVRTIIRQDNAEIESQAIEAENRLAAAKREEAARKKEDAIFKHKKAFEAAQSRMRSKYDLEIQDIEYQKRLHTLTKELEELQRPPPQPEEEPTGRGTSKKQKLRERAYAKRDSEIKRIDRKRVSPETKEALKRTAENELEEELRRIDEMP